MSPLPCWLGGAQNVCLNFSDCDVAVQLHFALFRGSSGFVLKPSEMRFAARVDPSLGSATSDISACHSDSFVLTSSVSNLCAHSSSSNDGQQRAEADEYWPPPHDMLHRTTILILSLHNCPKVRALLCKACPFWTD